MSDHSFPPAFFSSSGSGDQLMLTDSTLYARISPQWLSELRQLWPNVLGKLHVSSNLARFPHYAWTVAQSPNFVGCFGVTCHLHFWQNDRGLLRATAVKRGWNGHRIRVSTQSRLWIKRKFFRRSCRVSNSQPFDHESGALTIKLFRLQTN